MAAVTSAVVAAGGLALSAAQYVKQRGDLNKLAEEPEKRRKNILKQKKLSTCPTTCLVRYYQIILHKDLNSYLSRGKNHQLH